MDGYNVTIANTGQRLLVGPGVNLKDALAAAGIFLNTPCGGRGTCGKCRVTVVGRDGAPLERVQEVLACQFKVEKDLWLIAGEQKEEIAKAALVAEDQLAEPVRPLVKKVCISLVEPNLENPKTDWENLRDGLGYFPGELETDLETLRSLPKVLRDNGFVVTAVLAGKRLLAIEGGDTTGRCYGLAVDLGTTTLSASLWDLAKGVRIGNSIAPNYQRIHGADVLSRINHASSVPGGLAELQSLMVKGVNDIISRLAKETGISEQEIYLVTVAGNTTMQHFFLGLNPHHLAVAPFVGVRQEGVQLSAAEASLKINPSALVYVFPSVAGYVGGDTLGVILASRVYEADRPTLVVDLGTNGEIVLGSKNGLATCSTAAGPAFEGGNISCGMPALPGAVNSVDVVDGTITYSTIAEERPCGICGSGLIDLISQLRKTRKIDPAGVLGGEQNIFELVPLHVSQNGKPVFLTQADVREFQLAKAAILAGIRVLQKEMSIADEEIAKVLVAGTFGNYLNPAHAQDLGLFPPVPLSRIQAIGNAAQHGAELVLLNWQRVKEVETLAKSIKHVELSANDDFMDFFIKSIHFPAKEDEHCT
ncbi:MAG: ASKHA domain-containing protein [Bacillota bacterium]